MSKTKITLLVVLLALFSCKNTNKETTSVSEEVSTTEVKESSNQSQDNLNAEVIADSIERNQKFKDIDLKDLNAKLSQQKKELTAKEVMQLFYPHKVDENAEGNESISISEPFTQSGLTNITLIHDNLLDDSIKAEKYEMTLKKEGDKWTVLSLKENWACWEGRGHTNWGIQMCN